MIIILTAPIQSGKTTSLINWSAKRKEIYGILTPIVNGKRVFMDVDNKDFFTMEADRGDTETVAVGKFIFSKANFERAIQIIRNAINKKGWLIIDEIGPLELRGEGFDAILKEVLAERKENILLVAREGFAEKIQKRFQFDANIINIESLSDFY